MFDVMKKLIILLALLLPIVSFAQLDFTVNYVKHIKGYPVFEVRVPSHFIKMNEIARTGIFLNITCIVIITLYCYFFQDWFFG